MKHSQPVIKKLDELSFEDLYIEVPEQTYPALREASGRLFSKLHLRKHSRVVKHIQKDGLPVSAPALRGLHLKGLR